jgi:hypothetical protein
MVAMGITTVIKQNEIGKWGQKMGLGSLMSGFPDQGYPEMHVLH